MKRIDFVKWIISYCQSRQKDIGKWRMRMNVRCYVDSCCYCCDGECDLEEITISDHEMTASGFQPICQEYDEGICQDYEDEDEDK